MKLKNGCPACLEGTLTVCHEQQPVSYKGETKLLPLRFSVCDCCASELALPLDLRENKRISNEFKKQVDKLLTGCQLRTIRTEIWGITQQQASKIFGGGSKAFSKYESEDVIQSEAMDKLMRVASALPEAFDLLKQMAGEQLIVEKSITVKSSVATWTESSTEYRTDEANEAPSLAVQPSVDLHYSEKKNWRVRKVA
ncbi:type II toxin-antitoxin system MqsA family antitoxin [Pantoea agglomerans]|uniref:type II toxin-antitoxin system MqsA family antitoxin n=1 Tax=Enterobacter agglomerans TaxID=549 RepID=UPI003C79D952